MRCAGVFMQKLNVLWLDIKSRSPLSFYNIKNYKMNWYCLYFLLKGTVKHEWRQFESWEQAQAYGDLMYGLDLWQITSKQQ